MKVVFVHGFLGSANNWGPVLAKLRAEPAMSGFSFQAVELLGHGTRGQVEHPQQFSESKILEQLMKDLGSEPFVGVGHSYGLRPLLLFSKKSSGQMRALIVEDSSPEMSQQGRQTLDKIFSDINVPFESRDAARKALDDCFGRDSVMSRFLLSNIRQRDDGLHDWRFSTIALKRLLEEAQQRSLWDEWRDYPGTIGMILGDEGASYVTRARLDQCIQFRPVGQTLSVRISGAGHWVHSEQLNQFTAELVKLVKSFKLSD